MINLCDFIQIVMSIWSIFEPSMMPYITTALTEISSKYFAYKREKYILSVAKKYKEVHVVIDKNDAHEHIELDLNL